jgi:hypothetical protein
MIRRGGRPVKNLSYEAEAKPVCCARFRCETTEGKNGDGKDGQCPKFEVQHEDVPKPVADN